MRLRDGERLKDGQRRLGKDEWRDVRQMDRLRSRMGRRQGWGEREKGRGRRGGRGQVLSPEAQQERQKINSSSETVLSSEVCTLEVGYLWTVHHKNLKQGPLLDSEWFLHTHKGKGEYV